MKWIVPVSPAMGDFRDSKHLPYAQLVARTLARSMMKRDSKNPPADLKQGEGFAAAAKRAAWGCAYSMDRGVEQPAGASI